ncbi:MAG: hypothetical protein J3K34DRAFT_427676 [Monoraphidium minutum]|nr:MAG: hypothetical protein J3K34DRAFT_427676 [Monoraphidium minutum]
MLCQISPHLVADPLHHAVPIPGATGRAAPRPRPSARDALPSWRPRLDCGSQPAPFPPPPLLSIRPLASQRTARPSCRPLSSGCASLLPTPSLPAVRSAIPLASSLALCHSLAPRHGRCPLAPSYPILPVLPARPPRAVSGSRRSSLSPGDLLSSRLWPHPRPLFDPPDPTPALCVCVMYPDV